MTYQPIIFISAFNKNQSINYKVKIINEHGQLEWFKRDVKHTNYIRYNVYVKHASHKYNICLLRSTLSKLDPFQVYWMKMMAYTMAIIERNML